MKKTRLGLLDVAEWIEAAFYIFAAIAWVLAAIARWSSWLAIVLPIAATAAAVVGSVLIRRNAREKDRRLASELFR